MTGDDLPPVMLGTHKHKVMELDKFMNMSEMKTRLLREMKLLEEEDSQAVEEVHKTISSFFFSRCYCNKIELCYFN